LDELALSRIDWWGMAFRSAVIDAATIIGSKGAGSSERAVKVAVRDADSPLFHEIRQGDFRKNPRYTFNLYLTAEKRRVVASLDDCPKLGDFFEIHEGVHSGNIRSELFVQEETDETCRPLYFGRDEIRPYHLDWDGRFIRLGAMPARKTRDRYANAGKSRWHENPKVLVRRTGDYVLAAVDARGFYCSNNFFLVFPKAASCLSLDGLCALLNSRAITWYFRTIEPRKGRVFAELKIKHLRVFPLPLAVGASNACVELNRLGEQRREIEDRLAACAQMPHERNELGRVRDRLDEEINRRVVAEFRLDEEVETLLSRLLEEDVF
jgi:hypothetical protein